MKFPDDIQAGDLFWMSSEPVKILAVYPSIHGRYYDIEFLSIGEDSRSSATMTLIPIEYDFYGTEIRKMSSLEKELF
jgi:hypothetical protein